MPDEINPALIEVGEWWRYGLCIEATCSCGVVRTVPNLVQAVGARTWMSDAVLLHISKRMKCLRCGATEPTVRIVRVST